MENAIEEIKQFLNDEIKHQESNWSTDDHSMTVKTILDKVDEIYMVNQYKERIEKVELGESQSFEIKDAKELFEMVDCEGSKSIQEQYKEIGERKEQLTKEKRLNYLIKYHHNLSLQYSSMRGLGKDSLNHLDDIQREIDQLLNIKGDN